ncbi:MAG: ribosome small subunit-dependent GTPase A [Clostridia bacterium]|nr:ribosome small subunit-dependent GTPase A [Clostridia bacterium]
MNLKTIGMDLFFEEQIQANEKVGRVIRYAQNHYTLATEQGILSAELKGKLRQEELSISIGDFVVFMSSEDETLHLITRVLLRKTALLRKEAGTRLNAQTVAANMDYLFVVMSLNEDFNLRRLERYMVGAWESGAEPIVVLTKKDLCPNYEEKTERVETITYGAKTIVVSALEKDGMEQIEPYFQPGKTIALIGSSGVGKSTLINTLIGKDLMLTNGLRNDDKGRHTTTHRELIITERGMIMDTPGMREFALMDADDGLNHGFEDLEALMKSCKFSNCTHKNEPGCAVLEAIEVGSLEIKRYKNYQLMLRELKYFEKKNKHKESIVSSKKDKEKRKTKARQKKWGVADD